LNDFAVVSRPVNSSVVPLRIKEKVEVNVTLQNKARSQLEWSRRKGGPTLIEPEPMKLAFHPTAWMLDTILPAGLIWR
jgi:hypothetical protein